MDRIYICGKFGLKGKSEHIRSAASGTKFMWRLSLILLFNYPVLLFKMQYKNTISLDRLRSGLVSR